jgi:hypothetical protein
MPFEHFVILSKPKGCVLPRAKDHPLYSDIIFQKQWASFLLSSSVRLLVSLCPAITLAFPHGPAA